jgi:hypothetical protein
LLAKVKQYYTRGALVIAILQIIDGALHFANVDMPVRLFYSVVEIIWCFASLALLWMARTNRHLRRLAGFYTVYIVSFYGFAVMVFSPPATQSDYLAPAAMGSYAIVMGMAYLFLAVQTNQRFKMT